MNPFPDEAIAPGLPGPMHFVRENSPDSAFLAAAIEKALIGPIRDIIQRPSKHLRWHLVHVGYHIGKASAGEGGSIDPDCSLEHVCRIVEFLHAGSLIVDDIQDQSETRRGRPTLHRLIGTPRSIAAGNWLYFWPARMIEELPVDANAKLAMLVQYNQPMENAHTGQALDLAVDLIDTPRERIPELCRYVTRLKSGCLAGLAMWLGARLVTDDESLLGRVHSFGAALGIQLQNFDDIGNLLGHVEPEKRLEDLRYHKPGYVWGSAAALLDNTDYTDFVAAVCALPDDAKLQRVLERTELVERMSSIARGSLRNVFSPMQADLEIAPEAARIVSEIAERISHAYTEQR